MSANKGTNSERNPDGTFKPGHSVRKPKGKKHMTTLLREAIAREVSGSGESYDKMITKRVIKSALQGEHWAVKLVYEYLDGKPVQQSDITSDGEKIVFLDPLVAQKYNIPMDEVNEDEDYQA